MFKEFVRKLMGIERFDRITSTKDIKIGEVEEPSGATRLALQVPSGEVVTLEPRAESQLLSTWARSPRALSETPP